MCPDRELISAYFDDETNQYWSGKIKEHMGSCISCSNEVKKLDKISLILESSEVPDELEIKERLYKSLTRKRKVIFTQPVWKKHFDVSFPLLAVAAALVLILSTVMLFGFRNFTASKDIVEEIQEEPLNLKVQLISIEDAAAYLLSDDSGFDVLITIPAGEDLSLTGEPQLIREADYIRGQ